MKKIILSGMLLFLAHGLNAVKTVKKKKKQTQKISQSIKKSKYSDSKHDGVMSEIRANLSQLATYNSLHKTDSQFSILFNRAAQLSFLFPKLPLARKQATKYQLRDALHDIVLNMNIAHQSNKEFDYEDAWYLLDYTEKELTRKL